MAILRQHTTHTTHTTRYMGHIHQNFKSSFTIMPGSLPGTPKSCDGHRTKLFSFCASLSARHRKKSCWAPCHAISEVCLAPIRASRKRARHRAKLFFLHARLPKNSAGHRAKLLTCMPGSPKPCRASCLALLHLCQAPCRGPKNRAGHRALLFYHYAGLPAGDPPKSCRASCQAFLQICQVPVRAS